MVCVLFLFFNDARSRCASWRPDLCCAHMGLMQLKRAAISSGTLIRYNKHTRLGHPLCA